MSLRRFSSPQSLLATSLVPCLLLVDSRMKTFGLNSRPLFLHLWKPRPRASNAMFILTKEMRKAVLSPGTSVTCLAGSEIVPDATTEHVRGHSPGSVSEGMGVGGMRESEVEEPDLCVYLHHPGPTLKASPRSWE